MDIPLSQIRGIGPARVKALAAAGITGVRELVMCLPRDYRDMTNITPLGDARPGEPVACRVRVSGAVSVRRAGRLGITTAYVTDDISVMRAVWYNMPWIKDKLAGDQFMLMYGRVEARRGGYELSCPTIEKEARIIPVYKTISGIPARTLATFIDFALKECEGQWKDELPESLRRRYGLCERNFAMRQAHFPESREALAAARRRLAFEELLAYQVAIMLMRRRPSGGVTIESDKAQIEKYWKSLAFSPTGAQKRVLYEVADDMRSPRAMARLVQGDVGCGKTAIAFGAMLLCVQAGFQTALMAPTEVLAQQHFEGARALFEKLGMECGLLTGSLGAKAHREAHAAIKNGQWRVIIGTHALITEGVEYENLGLVVTDEQHRFGVRQRTLLSQKGQSPNVLVMSATPIPRTLALILYGDLDISIVDELPPGRTPVKTRVVPEAKRDGMYGFIKKEVAAGRQVYVVCPLVEESEAVDAKSAEDVFAELRDVKLKELRVTLVHGKMKPKEKDAVLEAFRAGEADVLVSTTVIEVGVNVPNASVMVIENAERFGLAQLHQLRGRVGRASYESWCFLMAEQNERLALLTRTNDGFVIAEKDMQLRGPGEMFGVRQAGAADGLSALAMDSQLLKQTHDEARAVIANPELPDSLAVIALAKESFARRMKDVAMN